MRRVTPKLFPRVEALWQVANDKNFDPQAVRILLALARIEGMHYALFAPLEAKRDILNSREVHDIVRDSLENIGKEHGVTHLTPWVEYAMSRELVYPLTNLMRAKHNDFEISKN